MRELNNLRPDTVANCSADEVVELLLKCDQSLALAAQVMTPSARDSSKGRRLFTSLMTTRLMTIPVRVLL